MCCRVQQIPSNANVQGHCRGSALYTAVDAEKLIWSPFRVAEQKIIQANKESPSFSVTKTKQKTNDKEENKESHKDASLEWLWCCHRCLIIFFSSTNFDNWRLDPKRSRYFAAAIAALLLGGDMSVGGGTSVGACQWGSGISLGGAVDFGPYLVDGQQGQKAKVSLLQHYLAPFSKTSK